MDHPFPFDGIAPAVGPGEATHGFARFFSNGGSSGIMGP